MIAKSFRALLAAALFAVALPTHAQLTFKDDLNRALILKAPAKRIVTLSPSLTELVYAAGAGDLVVGVDSLSDYPPEAKKVAQIPTGERFNIEAIATVKPDLVIAWREGIRRDDIERITAFGTTVFVAQARNLSDIPRLLETLGRMTARDTTPQVADFELRLEAVRRANVGKPRMSAFLEIWNRPLTTISGNHILSEALEVCRAENVFRELPGSAPKVSWDDVAREDPYVIVGAGSASSEDEFKANWRIRAGLSAVRADRLVYLESDAIQRPSPRTPEGIAQLCATLDGVRNPSAATAKVNPAKRPVSTAGAAAAPGASAAAAALLKPASSPGVGNSPAPPGTNPPASAPTAAAPETAVPAVPPAASAGATDQKPRRPSQYGM
jgi:iron complex transport system substrate-binding protein